MSSSRNSTDRARQSCWGYMNIRRGRILCIYVDDEKVVLVEPDGGYFFPMPAEVEPTEMPDERTLVSALTGLSFEVFQAISNFCSAPRTMQEIEDEFPGVEAWRLRRMGILKDVGRRKRRIVSKWAGWHLKTLLDHIFSLQNVPSQKENSPRS